MDSAAIRVAVTLASEELEKPFLNPDSSRIEALKDKWGTDAPNDDILDLAATFHLFGTRILQQAKSGK